MHPQLFDARPDLFAQLSSSRDVVSLAFSKGRALQHASLFAASMRVDGGPAPRASFASVQLPFDPLELAEGETVTWVVSSSGLWAIDWGLDGGSALHAVTLPHTVTNIVSTRWADAVAWGPIGATLVSAAGSAVPLGVPSDAGALVSLDVTSNDEIVAFAEGATFVAGRASPSVWGNASAGLTDAGPQWERFVYALPDGGTLQLVGQRTWADRVILTHDGGLLATDATFHAMSSVCEACGPGETADHAFVTNGAPLTVEVECSTSTGASRSSLNLESCERAGGSVIDPVRWSRGSRLVGAAAGAHGQLIASGELDYLRAISYGFASSQAGAVEYVLRDNRLLLLVPNVFEEVTGAGLVASALRSVGAAATDRHRPWLAVSQGSVYDYETASSLPPVSLGFANLGQDVSRETLSVVDTASGKTWAVLSLDDGLYSVDVTTSLAGTDAGPSVPPLAEIRLAPFPAVPIRSAVFARGNGDAGVEVSGYVLSSGGVAYVEAYAENAWQSTPLRLPIGNWLKLVEVRGVVLLVYSDGRVFTLPSRLQIGETLGVPLRDVVSVGGVPVASSAAGLFALDKSADGGLLGRWRTLSLPPTTTDPAALPADPGALVLMQTNDEAYVAGGFGTVWKLFADGGL